MKVLEFTYTKDNGDVSKRAIVEMVKPSKLLSGLDITELDNDTLVEFALEYNQIETQIASMRLELQKKYGLNHNFRMFKPENMTEITSEHI